MEIGKLFFSSFGYNRVSIFFSETINISTEMNSQYIDQFEGINKTLYFEEIISMES
jgi:hypothetical protein